jgi:predicted esterase
MTGGENIDGPHGVRAPQYLASLTWHEYPMEHEVLPEELSDIHDWLSRQLQ